MTVSIPRGNASVLLVSRAKTRTVRPSATSRGRDDPGESSGARDQDDGHDPPGESHRRRCGSGDRHAARDGRLMRDRTHPAWRCNRERSSTSFRRIVFLSRPDVTARVRR